MAIHVYHPNKNSTGFACSFSYSFKDNCFYATIAKQAGWDEATDNGTFKESFNDPLKHVNVKLTDTEACAILDCIERNRPFFSFHDNEEKPKGINFAPWAAKVQGNETPVQKGFSFSVKVTNKQDVNFQNAFYIGLTFAEARLIREFIIYSLHRRFEISESRTRINQSPKATASPQAEKPAEEAPAKKDDDYF